MILCLELLAFCQGENFLSCVTGYVIVLVLSWEGIYTRSSVQLRSLVSPHFILAATGVSTRLKDFGQLRRTGTQHQSFTSQLYFLGFWIFKPLDQFWRCLEVEVEAGAEADGAMDITGTMATTDIMDITTIPVLSMCRNMAHRKGMEMGMMDMGTAATGMVGMGTTDMEMGGTAGIDTKTWLSMHSTGLVLGVQDRVEVYVVRWCNGIVYFGGLVPFEMYFEWTIIGLLADKL
jgi:hypothetical protein